MRAWSDTTRRRWALALFGVLVLALLGDQWLATGLDDQPELTYPWQRDLDETAGILSTGIGGLWVTWARPRNAIGWLISCAGLALAVCNVLQTYGARALVLDEGLPLGSVAASLGAPLWIAAVAIPVTLILVRYPAGVIEGRWARRFDRLAVFGYLPLYAGYAVTDEAVSDVVVDGESPWPVPEAVGGVLLMVGALALLAAVVGIVGNAVWRVARAERRERMALLLLLLAAVVYVVMIFFGPEEEWGTWTYGLLLVAVAVGVLRYQALGIEIVVRRALVYATLTGLVLLVFVGLVAGLARVLPSGPVPQLVAAVVIAVGLAPARDRIQRVIDRLLYGERSDPWAALGRLRSSSNSDASLVPEVLAALAGGLHLSSAQVEDAAGRILAVWPAGSADGGPTDHAIELSLGGESVGVLRLGPRRGESGLGPADLRLLEAVAPLVAAVIRAESLADEVRTERTRVVEATHAERARLRQDLHDGLGPSLTGIGLGLEALSTRGHDPELVARLRSEVGSSLEETRRIIDDLRPAALDDHDLVGALRQRARQVTAALEVRMDLPETLPELSPDVEKAAFRIVDEALTNVVRHSAARRCTVHVTGGAALRISVTDDGVGVGAGRAEGVGLTSMRERAERLGGTFTIADLVPGTQVLVELPLAARPRLDEPLEVTG